MFGLQKLLILTVLSVSMGLVTSAQDNFLWKLFSKGKTFIMSNLNSERRTDGVVNQNQGSYQNENSETGSYHKPEHREEDTEGGVQAYDHYNDYHHSHTQIIQRDNMELYTLLGGLSFASLLATTLVLFSRRNGSLLRSAPETFFRKQDDSESPYSSPNQYEMIIKVPQLIHRISKVISPWWSYRTPLTNEGSRSFQPVNLTYPKSEVNTSKNDSSEGRRTKNRKSV